VSRRQRSSTTTHVRRTASVIGGAFGVVLALGATAPVWARGIDDGEVRASPLALGQAALIYVGIPLAIIAVIWLLASIPYMVHAPRYRPGLSWWAKPVWFEGPVDGGAGDGAAEVDPLAPATRDGGGTSARW
jgi:hypothetical protein